MRNWLFLLAFMGSSCASLFAGDPEEIQEIRRLYTKIVHANPLETVEMELDEDILQGTLTRRRYHDGLLAITVSYGQGDHGGADERFYYRENEPFFLFIEEGYWRFDTGGTAEQPATRDFATQERFYVVNGTCIRALQKSVESSDPEAIERLFREAANQPIEPGERFRELLERAYALRDVQTSEEAAGAFAP